MPIAPDQRLVVFPDKRLRQPSAAVETINGEIRELGRDIVFAMRALSGRGLAAIQIGAPVRLIVVRLIDGHELVMANPEITWSSSDFKTRREGCLSIPGVQEMVVRPRRVRARFLDMQGTAREHEFDEHSSNCAQHEIDHLDGTLFFDHVSRLKKDMLIRKSAKFIEAEARKPPQKPETHQVM